MPLSINKAHSDYGSISPANGPLRPDPEPPYPPCCHDSQNAANIPETPDGGCRRQTGVDGAWAWLVAVSSFFIIMTVGGVCFTTGIISEAFVLYFRLEHDVAKGSVPGAVLQAMYLGAGPLASVLSALLGYRVVAVIGSLLAIAGFICGSYVSSIELLTLTYGVMSGLGFALLFLPSMVMTTIYFNRWRTLAVGLATCGSGVGIMVYPRLARYILDLSSWRWCLQIQAVMALLCLLAAFIFRPLQTDDASQNRSMREALSSSFKLSLLRNPIFILLLMMAFASTIGIIIPFNYIPMAAVERNLTQSEGAWLVSIMGATNTAGRLIIGVAAYKAPCHPFVFMIIANVMGAGATFISVWCSNFLCLAVYCALFGLVFATDAVLCTIILVRTLGEENLSGSFGSFCLVRGITGIIVTPIAGKLHDYTKTYQASFYLSTAALALMIVLSVVALIIARKQEHHVYEHLERARSKRDAVIWEVSVGSGSLEAV